MWKLLTVLGSLLFLTPSVAALKLERSPGCDDHDPATKCCPLENFPNHVSGDPADWNACNIFGNPGVGP